MPSAGLTSSRSRPLPSTSTLSPMATTTRTLSTMVATSTANCGVTAAGAHKCAPLFWRKRKAKADDDEIHLRDWVTQHFDEPEFPLHRTSPVAHVSWYEVSTYARRKGRRFPTEAEWEVAALCEPATDDEGFFSAGRSADRKLFPWGDEPPSSKRCNLNWARGELLDVDALRHSDSDLGCLQMMGQLWE